ncbi:MAG: RHS repeat protein [Myxococcaceae bacterium]|nr:RHS repeat protein [Myxococcaceae bacterium]
MKRAVITLALAWAGAAAAQDKSCSPFDQPLASFALPDGGADTGNAGACCQTSSSRCHKTCRAHVGAPVDVLNGNAWLDRTDIDVAMPWGPPYRLARTYSTAWVQGTGSTTERSTTGVGWMHTWQAYLSLLGPAGAVPAPTVWMRLEDTSLDVFTRTSAGTYVTDNPGATLTWNASTQLYVANRPSGQTYVFDAAGRLRTVRATDGGEAQLRYGGEDAACPVSATQPMGALCRVDFLFGRALYFRYAGGFLETVAMDAAFSQPVVRLTVTNGQLTRSDFPDGRFERFDYAFTMQHLGTPGATATLLTLATDTDGGLVESFRYSAPALTPARVAQHETPGESFSFTWPEYNAGPVRRETIVRGSQNLRFRWTNGIITSKCVLDSDNVCTASRLLEYVPEPTWFDTRCERNADGYYTLYQRDAVGRVTAETGGLAACDTPSTAEARFGQSFRYLGDTNRRVAATRDSVDTSAPSGFRVLSVDDYAAQWDGGTALADFNQAPLAPRPQRHVRVGRTLVDTAGTWGTQVQAETYRFDAQGRLVATDGPRSDVSDETTLDWAAPPREWAVSRRTVGGRVVATFTDIDARGRAARVTDESGAVTVSTYDALGRLETSLRPGETSPTILRRGPSSRMAEVVEPTGIRNLHEYTAKGVLSAITRRSQPTGAIDTRTQYEAARGIPTPAVFLEDINRVREVDVQYDNQGRLAGQTVSRRRDTFSRWMGFDEEDRLAWMADEGRGADSLVEAASRPSHRYTYDRHGRLSVVQQRLGGWATVARFEYDIHGNLSAFVDAKGVRQRFVHDDFGRLVEVESPDMGLWRFMYDEAGNLIRSRRPDGVETRMRYDASNRLIETVAGALTETTTYDAPPRAVTDCATGQPLLLEATGGRVAHVADESGEWFFGYWPRGDARFEGHVWPGASCAQTLEYGLGPTGLPTGMRYPSGLRVEYDYPDAGQRLRDRPIGLTLVNGAQRVPLVSGLVFTAGELTGATTAGGAVWRMQRWTEGSPAEVSLGTTNSSVVFHRRRVFGTSATSTEPAFDAWGNPLAITEATAPDWTSSFSYDVHPALVGVDGGMGRLTADFLASGDRNSANGVPYCYEAGSHRLSTVGPTTYRWNAFGALSSRDSPEGPLTLCYDARARVASTVTPSGEVYRLVHRANSQRTREEWSLAGLHEDFRADDANRLLVEWGVGSLSSLYPRPVKEYVWLGQHPVAILHSLQPDAASPPVLQRVAFLHSGHLGEVLAETDAQGRLWRQTLYSAFGEKLPLPPLAQPQPLSAETAHPYPQTRFSFRVTPPLGARALKLRFEGVALAPCDSIDVTEDASGDIVVRLPSSASGTVDTDWLPARPLTVSLAPRNCGSAYGFRLTQLTPDFGPLDVSPRTEATPNPYPAAGQQFSFSFSQPTSLRLTNVSFASCDVLEARSASGTPLWSYRTPPSSSVSLVTPPLSGAVSVGIWGQGCNATERRRGFTVASASTFVPTPAAASMTLPGQVPRYDGTVDNWYRLFEP